MRLIKYTLALLIAATLAACAGTGERQGIEDRLLEMGYELGEADSRIPRYRVNGWRSIDSEYLIITAGVNDNYLVKLRSPCFYLPSAFSIGFTTPMSSLDRFSSIVVRSTGRGRERCDIEDIVQLNPIN